MQTHKRCLNTLHWLPVWLLAPRPIRTLNSAGGAKGSHTSEYWDEVDEWERKVRGQRSEAALTHSQAEEQKGLVRVNAPGLLPQQRRNQTSPGQRGGRGDRAGLCRGSCAGKRKWKEECAENQRRTGDSETPRRKTTAKQSTQTSNGQVTFHPRITGKRFYIKIICINSIFFMTFKHIYTQCQKKKKIICENYSVRMQLLLLLLFFY